MAITILRPTEAWRRLGHGRATGYNRIDEGLLPPPIPIGPIRKSKKEGRELGPSMVGFLESEIDAINTARVAGKTDEEIRELVKALVKQRAAARVRVAVVA